MLHEQNLQETEQRCVVTQSRRHINKTSYLTHSQVCPAVSFLPGPWAFGSSSCDFSYSQQSEAGDIRQEVALRPAGPYPQILVCAGGGVSFL